MRHDLCCTAVRDGLRYRTVRHGLLKMMPYLNVALGRALQSRSLRGNVPPCRIADTLRAAGEPDVLPDVAVYADDVLSLAAADGVVVPSCSRGWAAGGAVAMRAIVATSPLVAAAAAAAVAMRAIVATLPLVAAAAAAAVAVAMRTTVVASPRVAGAGAAGGASVDVLVDDGPDHRRGARLTACPFCLCLGFHLRSRLGRFPHG